MSRILVATLALAAGCSYAVPIRSPYGEAPEGRAIRNLAALTIHDLRGRRVGSKAHTTTVDLPDTATSSTTYGSYSSYTTTTYDDNTVTVTTGNTLGSDMVEDVDEVVARFARESTAFRNVPIVPVGEVVSFDHRGLKRAADGRKVTRLVWFDLSEYEYWTDTQSDAMAWAYLGGLTLGLSLPFMPLERWNASVSISGDVYLWESGEGIVKRQAFDQAYRQRGPGIPGYQRVFRGVGSWADTRIAEDLLEAYATIAR